MGRLLPRCYLLLCLERLLPYHHILTHTGFHVSACLVCSLPCRMTACLARLRCPTAPPLVLTHCPKSRCHLSLPYQERCCCGHGGASMSRCLKDCPRAAEEHFPGQPFVALPFQPLLSVMLSGCSLSTKARPCATPSCSLPAFGRSTVTTVTARKARHTILYNEFNIIHNTRATQKVPST